MTDKTTPEGLNRRHATEPDGISHAKVAGDDDVEGHRYSARTTAEPDGISHAKVAGDDDVEGHSILDPFAARELARARERDVQQHAKRHEFERDARDAKKDRS